MNAQSFYFVFVSFFCGIFVASLWPIPLSYGCGVLLVLGVLFLFLYASRKKRICILLFWASVFFAIGLVRMSPFNENTSSLDSLVGTSVSFEGTVCAEPVLKELTQNFCFSPHDASDRILITSARYPEFSYGDVLSVSGKLLFPKNFEAYEGGPEFDYVSYLAKDGIGYVMQRPKVEKVGEGGGSPILETLFDIKHSFMRKAENLFPEPESSLLGGLLLGDRGSLPKDVTEEFKNAGLIHILVLSGYNVTIVAENLMKIFSFLPRAFGQLFGILSIIFFALMTGASATTVRASIMALIAILARSASRCYSVSRALIIAAFFMVLQNPRILVFDISFELSFLATLGLVCVSPLISERLTFITERWKLREIVSTTLATQLFVLPLLIHSMGQVSLVFLISNVFVLPIIPHAMLFGFLSIVFGYVSETLAQPFAWISNLPLSYILSAASLFGNIPFASIRIHAGAWALACMYGLYAFVFIRAWRRRNSSLQIPN